MKREDEILDILNSPEYFYCERTRCRLRIAVCIKRQEANQQGPVSFPVCEGCSQGAKNQSMAQPGGDMSGNPKPEEQAGIRLCEDCREKPTMSPGCPYCPSCMSRRAHKARKLQGTSPKTPRREAQKSLNKASLASRDKCLPQSRESLTEADTALKVDFGRHAHILREIEKLAEQQIRPVELQIIYMLKTCLDGMGSTA